MFIITPGVAFSLVRGTNDRPFCSSESTYIVNAVAPAGLPTFLSKVIVSNAAESTVALPNTTSSVVPTDWPIATAPSVIVTPVPPEKCALTSAALGPVYVSTPVLLL